MSLDNMQNYGYYKTLVETGTQAINTKDINNLNIDMHWNNIISILDDGIETDFVRSMRIIVTFTDNETVSLNIFQYMYNLMFWCLIVCAGNEIASRYLFFEKVINKGNIKKYIDTNFIRLNIKKLPLIDLNQNIDRCIGKFRDLRNFQMYLANSVNFYDTIEMMQKYKDFDDSIHFDASNIPMEDIKERGLESAHVQIKHMIDRNSDHCMKYSFISNEGINPKQFKEVNVNIGTKPDGKGGVFQHPINTSFINGGLRSVEDIVIDSSIGRIAQILTKQNVGQSGAFARRLGLNNQDSKLYPDPNYICDTRNFEEVEIKNEEMLKIYDMRFYRFNEDGIEYLLDATKDKHLIGQTLLFRSPMTCASAARGQGICYRCYGNLAYANANINIGQIAAEQLSSIYTQTLLSAKHLLESAIIKLKWSKDFYTLFNVEFDQISLKDDIDYKKYRLIISSDDIVEDEVDEDADEAVEESAYLYSFTVIYPDGHSVVIRTSDSDPIYITNDMEEFLSKEGETDDGTYDINMQRLKNMCIFMVDIQNDELSKTMKQVKNLIDNKASIRVHDRNSLLSAFITANLKGNIKINAVHFETLLMNQMRDAADDLESPDWTLRNAPYQIITLDDSLVNNKSISVRLNASKLKRTLNHPSNNRLYKPSNIDLFMMEKPQLFMNQDFIDNTEEDERKVISPMYFETKKFDKGVDDGEEGD